MVDFKQESPLSPTCAQSVKLALGHLQVLEKRAANRERDKSPQQAAKDACAALCCVMADCKDHAYFKSKVEQALTGVAVESVAKAKDLGDVNVFPLLMASPALQEALIVRRPFFEGLHWRLAFKFPKVMFGPSWWS